MRLWQCPKCQTIHDRDVNAAKNIRDEGLRIVAVGHIASPKGGRKSVLRHEPVKDEAQIEHVADLSSSQSICWEKK